MKELTDAQREHAIDRILSRVTPTGPGYNGTPCSSYTGGLNTDGYARIWVAGRKVYAHRIALEWFRRRAIPAGEVVDHLCRLRCCQNVLHLRTCTNEENSARNSYAAQKACKHKHPLHGDNLKIKKRVRKWVRADGMPRTAIHTERQCRRCIKQHKLRYRMKYRRRTAAKRALIRAVRRLAKLNIDPREIFDRALLRQKDQENECSTGTGAAAVLTINPSLTGRLASEDSLEKW